MTSSSHPHLMSPGKIGGLELPNRILMTPMGSNLAEADGHMGERIKAYYEARARGGVGLIVVGVGAICWPAGACNPNQVAISDDSFLPGLSDLTRRVHGHGGKIAIQLQHASKVAIRDIAAGRPMLVPSIPEPKAGDLMNDLTPEEKSAFVAPYTSEGSRIRYEEMTPECIAEITQRFAEAAERAQRAGFDGVEIHAGHGYLLSAFLSPASNKRKDAYGGPLENRARFLMEVLEATKRRVGKDFPVWCRIDATELETQGGICFEDAKRTAEWAEAAGADAIHVSAYADPMKGHAFTQAPLVHTPMGFVDYAAGIKQCVTIPVIAVGRIDPDEAEQVISQGKADFVAMGRKLLADPDLPNKLKENHPEDVRPCIYCYVCVGEIFLNRGLRCAVNPSTGREFEVIEERSMTAPSPTKEVLVIGAGPAGMETARIAALRGHRVTLVEKSEQMGGTLFFASLAYEANTQLVRWLETQVRKLPIELKLGCEATPERVKKLDPDAIVVAIGARRQRPALPGMERPLVYSGDDLRQLFSGGRDSGGRGKLNVFQRILIAAGRLIGATKNVDRIRKLTRLWMPLGKRVTLIGGGLVGIELAEFLLERGREVTVLEESKNLASSMSVPRRWRSLHALRSHQVRLETEARVEAIEEGAVAWRNAAGERETHPADAVILASGTEANPGLGEALQKDFSEVHLIGDCSGLGYIEGALADAARIGRKL